MVTGTRILWKEKDYDRKVIRYLEKEFGKQISRSYQFWKYIPSNKRLTNTELTALVSHLDLFEISLGWKRKRYKFADKKYRHLSRFSKLIRQYGYDAFGDRTEDCWDSDEILVYNPSKVVPVSFHRLAIDWNTDREAWDMVNRVDYSHPLDLAELKKISEEEEADWQRWDAENEA
jgi:hypothetical protein